MWLVLQRTAAPHARGAARLDPLTAKPQDYTWTRLPEPEFPLPPYARFLSEVRIVLDPGHLGQRDPGGTWKRGPTGLREAEANLRVALFLREFLQAAGARAVLTREEDRSLNMPDKEDLRHRIDVANELRADLFLSIHHNAIDDPRVNYSTVFYHGDAAENPASVAAGRHIVTGLHDALRLERQLECALVSDFAIHDGNGFGVLRDARVPALLSEASFHSNPAEEARLRDPLYNRREAYGLFLGLARWAKAGLPRISLVSAPSDARRGGEVLVSLDDGLSARGGMGAEEAKVLLPSFVVKLDGEPVPYRLDWPRRRLRVSLPRGLRASRPTLFVDFENLFGQHVLHPRLELNLAGAG